MAHENKFSDSLVAANHELWDAMAAHPWVQELAAGTLSDKALIAWAQQCRLYCLLERKALLVLRGTLQAEEQATPFQQKLDPLLAQLQDDTIREPRELADTLKSLGAPLAKEPWPVCLGYGSFVQARAHEGILEGLAAVYACERAYLDTWTTVLPSVPPGSRWHDWVNNWTQDDFRRVVDAIGECVDEIAGPDPSDEISQRMHDAFRGVALYELAFWEMSYKQQGWPSLNPKEETPNA